MISWSEVAGITDGDMVWVGTELVGDGVGDGVGGSVVVVDPEVLVCTGLNDGSSVIDTVGVPDGIGVGPELDG